MKAQQEIVQHRKHLRDNVQPDRHYCKINPNRNQEPNAKQFVVECMQKKNFIILVAHKLHT